MRVLIAMFAAAASGCYSPAIGDCQFQCGTGSACPDGAACVAGVCRTTTNGTCATEQPDAMMTQCPVPPTGCSGTFTISTGCATTCQNALSWQAAMSACAAPWQLAVLDNPADLMAVPRGSASINYWVGAQLGSGGWTWLTGTAVSSAEWDFGYPSAQGGSCASVDTRRDLLRNQAQCGFTQVYLCTAP